MKSHYEVTERTLIDVNNIPLSANYIKWSNTLTQFVSNSPTDILKVFNDFVRLALKEYLWLSSESNFFKNHKKETLGILTCNGVYSLIQLQAYA